MPSLSLSVFSALAFGIIGAYANPIVAPAAVVTPAPSLDRRSTTCTFSGSSGASLASKSKTSCSTIVLSDVAVPSGVTLDLTKLSSGTHVIFEGTTTFGYKEWTGPLVSISGTSVTVTGASGSVLDGDGSRWWDGEGSNGGKTKPKFFYAHGLDSSSITGITIKNSPVHVFSIQSNGLTLTDVTINNKDGDSGGGHNTDGFDISSSSNVIIDGATVYNQDDCMAVNSGTDITFKNGYCSGGHGLSIGSVNNNAVVDTVTISNSQVVNSANAVRIKTVSGATGGSVKGVTYSGITFSGITSYGIVIEQDYLNGGPTGTPTGGIPITGLTVKNVVGTVTSSATDIYILCASGACSNWTWSGNSVTGGKTSTKCSNVPSPAKC